MIARTEKRSAGDYPMPEKKVDMISTAHRREKLWGIKPFLPDFVKKQRFIFEPNSQIRIGSLPEANGFFGEKGGRESYSTAIRRETPGGHANRSRLFLDRASPQGMASTRLR